MKHTLTLIAALLLAALTSLHAAARPNIIVILSDDLGWADLSCYGSTFHDSPNLDKLATQGMRFTQAYSSSPPTGPVLASVEVKPSGQADSGEFLSIPATLTNANGLTDVCVVARCAEKNTELGLNWIEFQP
jgi:hypothetical protein